MTDGRRRGAIRTHASSRSRAYANTESRSGSYGAETKLVRRVTPFGVRARAHAEDETQALMTPPTPLAGDPLLTAVTDAMIALHRRYHHRIPVTAKTLMLGDDLLACVLGGVCTDVEKTMIEVQRGTTVQETRSAFQNAMQHSSSIIRGDRWIEVVSETT
jgi:hypothetical protein